MAARPLLPQNNLSAAVLANNLERVLTSIDADNGNPSVDLLRHDVLLVYGAPCQLQLLAERGRTSAARLAAIPAGERPANRAVQTLL
jgi:hypothetical protein